MLEEKRKQKTNRGAKKKMPRIEEKPAKVAIDTEKDEANRRSD